MIFLTEDMADKRKDTERISAESLQEAELIATTKGLIVIGELIWEHLIYEEGE